MRDVTGKTNAQLKKELTSANNKLGLLGLMLIVAVMVIGCAFLAYHAKSEEVAIYKQEYKDTFERWRDCTNKPAMVDHVKEADLIIREAKLNKREFALQVRSIEIDNAMRVERLKLEVEREKLKLQYEQFNQLKAK